MVSDQARRPDRLWARKPAGGFQFIPAAALLAAWRAYQRGDIRLPDLREWFAVQERCATRRAAYRHRPDAAGADLPCARGWGRRLRRAGLLVDAAGSVRPPCRFNEVPSDLVPPEVLDLVPNHARQVPVPRRILRYLARATRPAIIAATIAHLLRGLYYREGSCVSGGSCKASWIASVFGMDLRTAKDARRTLIDHGWLVLVPTNQQRLNRWGQPFVINMDWTANDAAPVTSPPPRSNKPIESPPPDEDRELSQGRSDDQKRPGWCQALSEPDWRHVRESDLRDPRRLARLYRSARLAGALRDSPAQRLAFFAAASHAMRTATRSPGGMFAAIVRRGLWHHASDRDEDHGRRQLLSLRRSAPPVVRSIPSAATRESPKRSPDPSHDFCRAGQVLLGVDLGHVRRAVAEHHAGGLDPELLPEERGRAVPQLVR